MQPPPRTTPEGLLIGFDLQPRTRLVFGNGTVLRVGELARELNGQRVLLVTDKGIVHAGHATRVEQALQQAGLTVVTYDLVRENPTTRDLDHCLAAARAGGIDFIVGLGGGSSMDTAKGANFLLTNGGRMQDYCGVGKATKPMLPLIAIPTTAGTGSECQSAALIADEITHQKMACLDPKAAARVAILDPELTVSQPPAVTAHTGVDAIAHAVETMVTRQRTPLSQLYSREAFKLCMAALPRVLAEPGNLEARGRMLLGAAFAGMAIENSMLGAAHAVANPLTVHFGVVHGEAVGVMLPWVVRFNAADASAQAGYRDLALAAGLASAADAAGDAVQAVVERLEATLNLAGVAPSLADLGVERSAISMLAAEAVKQWTTQFNPRPVNFGEFAALYEKAFLRREGNGGGEGADPAPITPR